MSEFYLTDEHYRIAEENGIERIRVYQRVNENGWDIQRAITQPVKRHSTVWREHEELANKNGIKCTTFISRIKKGMTPKEAATTPVGSIPKRRKITKGKLTKEHYAIAEANGIPRATVAARVYTYDWTVEEAISTPRYCGRGHKNLKRRTFVANQLYKKEVRGYDSIV